MLYASPILLGPRRCTVLAAFYLWCGQIRRRTVYGASSVAIIPLSPGSASTILCFDRHRFSPETAGSTVENQEPSRLCRQGTHYRGRRPDPRMCSEHDLCPRGFSLLFTALPLPDSLNPKLGLWVLIRSDCFSEPSLDLPSHADTNSHKTRI